MSLINNAVSEVGDQIIIQMQIPIVGITAISGFIDSTIGELPDRYFDRKFRYSLDGGLNWSSLLDLTATALQNIAVEPEYDILFEYTYTRQGSNTTGVLIFNQVQIQGSYQIQEVGDVFANSVFAYFFTNINESEIQLWAINVLQKLYKPGIVSKSLTRNQVEGVNDFDRDYIDFWRSITTFFGLFVGYARKFEKFQTIKTLLVKFLEARDMNVCSEMSLFDLNYILNNYYDEMRHRGTMMIAKKKGELISDLYNKPVDGELLRLICYDQSIDEFLFSVQEFTTSGWVINEYSPLWRGVYHQRQLNKMYEKPKAIEDLSLYPLIDPSLISIFSDVSIGSTVMSIENVPGGSKAGIGDPFQLDKAIVINPALDYYFSFMVRRGGLAAGTKISVRFHAFNEVDTPIEFIELASGTLSSTNDAITFLEIPFLPEYLLVQVNLYGYQRIADYDPLDFQFNIPPLFVGSNLYFTNNMVKIIPEVVLDNNTLFDSDILFLWNFILTPLMSEENTSFIDMNHLIMTWLQNNNITNSYDQMVQIISDKLVPIGSTLFITQM